MMPESLRVLLWPALLTAAVGTAPGLCGAATVPVFVPGYRPEAWSLLRGSVVASDQQRAETTYTIFCAVQSQQSCEIAGDFSPFTFAEGPGTLHFEGRSPGTLTADLACSLAGTTAATCTGYSSYADGVTEGRLTGPTETSWTSTFSGSDVQWGVLTMTTPPVTTPSLDLTNTDMGDSGSMYTAGGSPTSGSGAQSSGGRGRSGGCWLATTGWTALTIAAMLGTAVL